MPAKPTPNRRQSRIATRLDQILQAAARLFAAKGFHPTTTREIANAADVSEGTLYNYFDSKDDILFGILARVADAQGMESWSTTAQPSSARQYFRSMLQFRRDFAKKNPAMMQAILSEILSNKELGEQYYQKLLEPMTNALEKNLQLRIELGQIQPIDVPMTARALAGMLTGLFILEMLGDPLVVSGSEELSEAITSMVFDGISPKKTKTTIN